MAGGLGGGVHVREHRLDHLLVPDRLAELAAKRRVPGRGLQGALGDAHGLGGDARAGALEGLHRDGEALAFVTQAVGDRDADPVEGELSRGRTANAHLVLEAGHLEARAVGLDEEGPVAQLSERRAPVDGTARAPSNE